MIISKKFNDFKYIINNIEKRKMLLRGDNWFQRWRLWIWNDHQVIIENDKIIIPFASGKNRYNAIFARNKETDEILIQNSIIGAIWFYFINRLICKRIEKNWEKCQDKK